jgi:hypothetical protein
MACISRLSAQPVLSENFDQVQSDGLYNALLSNSYLSTAAGKGTNGSIALRARYVGSSQGSERIVINYPLPVSMLEATLNFDVNFETNFQWVLGGILHGLGPKNKNTGLTALVPYGWSARALFQPDGVIHTYSYDQIKIAAVGLQAVPFNFKKGQYYAMSYHVKVNDPPSLSNGFIKIYANGTLVAKQENIRFRGVDGDTTLICKLLFSTFHGGQDESWAPKNPDGSYATVYALFDNFAVYRGSHVRTVVGDDNIPGLAAPTLVSPSNGAGVQSPNASLKWNAVSGASTYRVQLSTSSDFSTMTVDDTALTSASMIVGPLLAGTTWYWRVSAGSAGSISAWSEVWSFTTSSSAPKSPILVSPSDSAGNQPLNLTLKWNAVAGASNYWIQLSTIADFSSHFDDSLWTSATKNIGPLESGITYYWRIRAGSADGAGGWSAAWSFTTAQAVPKQVLIVSPVNSAAIGLDNAVFCWRRLTPEVDKYCLEIFADSLQNNRIYVDSTITDTVNVVERIIYKSTYWWHCKAHNSAGWGIPSDLRKFSLSTFVSALPARYICNVEGVSQSGSTITYELPAASRVAIRVYTMQGKLVQTLRNTVSQPGYYRVGMNTNTLSKGLYLLDFNAGAYQVRKKISNFQR